jgi:hypothetical protein
MELAKKLIELYDEKISILSKRFPTDKQFHHTKCYLGEALGHVKWMLNVLSYSAKDWNPTKAHRWIGFIQGVLWASGRYTIDELREHVNPPKVGPYFTPNSS